MKRLTNSNLRYRKDPADKDIIINDTLFTGKKLAVYDLEVYPNYFLAMFLSIIEGVPCYFSFTQNDLPKLRNVLDQKDLILISFNGLFYDDIIIKYIIYNTDCTMKDIFDLNESIINMPKDRPKWYWDLWNLDETWGRSVDMMKVPNRQGGLKERGAACKLKTIRDLPIKPGSTLTNQEIEDTYEYCKNDLLTTLHFFNSNQDHLENRLKLEAMYPGVDVLSQHDPGVGEKIMTHLYCEKNNVKKWKLSQLIEPPGKYIEIKDCIPHWVEFETDKLKSVLSHYQSIVGAFSTDADVAKLKHEFSFMSLDIQMGAGGLHTKDNPLVMSQNKDFGMMEIDVSGYYTGLIKALGIRPSHMNSSFNEILDGLVEERLKAKATGDKIKDKGLKIITLSIFGKTKDKFSIMFDEQAQLSITLAGQFSILRLIEMLRLNHYHVLSANTDGVLIRIRKQELEHFRTLYKVWEMKTNQKLEEIYYTKYIRRDVNNYMAVDLKGEIIKTKGVFKKEQKGQASIISEAVRMYFLTGSPPTAAISCCTNIKAFAFYFHASRGWDLLHKRNEGDIEVQKTCRWYVSKKVEARKGEGFFLSEDIGQMIKRGQMTDNEIERYKVTHKTVKHPDNWMKFEKLQNGNNSVLINELPDVCPEDIDRGYYIRLADELIKSVEIERKPLKMKRFNIGKSK